MPAPNLSAPSPPPQEGALLPTEVKSPAMPRAALGFCSQVPTPAGTPCSPGLHPGVSPSLGATPLQALPSSLRCPWSRRGCLLSRPQPVYPVSAPDAPPGWPLQGPCDLRAPQACTGSPPTDTDRTPCGPHNTLSCCFPDFSRAHPSPSPRTQHPLPEGGQGLGASTRALDTHSSTPSPAVSPTSSSPAFLSPASPSAHRSHLEHTDSISAFPDSDPFLPFC